jgi:hypothetical protein
MIFSHYTTSRKVAGSIPLEVNEFLNWPNPSSSTMALESAQPLTEMSTRNLPGAEAVFPNYPENVGAATCHKSTDLHGMLQGQLNSN